MNEHNLSTVAFVTGYKIGLPGTPSAWYERDGRRVLALQNDSTIAGYAIQNLALLEALLLEELEYVIVCLDHFGSGSGSTSLLKMICGKIPAERITCLLCECHHPDKNEELIKRYIPGAYCLRSECGGIQTMGLLFNRFLSGGEKLLDFICPAWRRRKEEEQGEPW